MRHYFTSPDFTKISEKRPWQRLLSKFELANPSPFTTTHDPSANQSSKIPSWMSQGDGFDGELVPKLLETGEYMKVWFLFVLRSPLADSAVHAFSKGQESN